MTASLWRLPIVGLLLGGVLSGAAIGGADAAFHHASAARPVEDAIRYLPADTLPAGTELPNGLSVPTGTRLLGAIFPVPQPGAADAPVWEARFVLTAAPDVALRSLVGQLRSGIAPNGSLGCQARDANGSGWGIGARHHVPAGAGSPVAVSCELSAMSTGPLAVRGAGVAVEATLDYGAVFQGAPADADLVLRVAPGDSGWQVVASPSSHPLRPNVPVFTTLMSAPRPVPQPGDLTAQAGVAPLAVVDGSQPVAAASVSGFVARVTGDPDAVFNAYVRELEARGGATATVSSGTSPYGAWRSAGVDSGSDEGNGNLVMVTSSDGTFIVTSVT